MLEVGRELTGKIKVIAEVSEVVEGVAGVAERAAEVMVETALIAVSGAVRLVGPPPSRLSSSCLLVSYFPPLVSFPLGSCPFVERYGIMLLLLLGENKNGTRSWCCCCCYRYCYRLVI